MNNNENLKLREKTLDKLVSGGVVIRPTLNNLTFSYGCKFVQWDHSEAYNFSHGAIISLSIALGKPNGIVTSLASDFERAANCKIDSKQYNHLFY